MPRHVQDDQSMHARSLSVNSFNSAHSTSHASSQHRDRMALSARGQSLKLLNSASLEAGKEDNSVTVM